MPFTISRNLRQQVVVEKKRRNIVFFTLITLAFLYMGIALTFGNMGLIKYFELKKTQDKLMIEVKDMEEENKTLNAQIKSLKEDPFYIEKHAREEFGMARPDEYIFRFEDDDR